MSCSCRNSDAIKCNGAALVINIAVKINRIVNHHRRAFDRRNSARSLNHAIVKCNDRTVSRGDSVNVIIDQRRPVNFCRCRVSPRGFIEANAVSDDYR